MAYQYGGEDDVAEFRELHANCMAVDCNGKFVLLAGRKSYALIDLESPQTIRKLIHRHNKWEVSGVQWNPHSQCSQYYVSVSNKQAEIYRWADGNCVLENTLISHTRHISDVDWAVFDPNILATCSLDTCIYVWDRRTAKKPSLLLSSVTGASQVKWNKVNEHIIATSHDQDIRIWDQRKGVTPIEYIAGHLSMIHGLDWSPRQENILSSASQDSNVKFWDIKQPRKEVLLISTGAPVWKARHTPFGSAVLTVVFPQLRRGENNLMLWNTQQVSTAVHKFIGHSDVVLDFHWMKVDPTSYYDQLVTWSKDQTLRIWRIDSYLRKLCGEDSSPDPSDTNLYKRSKHGSGASADTMSSNNTTDDLPLRGLIRPSDEGSSVKDLKSEKLQPFSLRQEFSLLNADIPNISINQRDAENRMCSVTATVNGHFVRVFIKFPPAYPNNVAPVFRFDPDSLVDVESSMLLKKKLDDTALQHVRGGRSCLEPCVRQLATAFEPIASKLKEKQQQLSDNEFLRPNPIVQTPAIMEGYGGPSDQHIPFPRTSGARFCGVDRLVCFRRPSGWKRAGEPTPRSLSALADYCRSRTQQTTAFNMNYPRVGSPSKTADTRFSISTYYYRTEKRNRWQVVGRQVKGRAEDEQQTRAGPIVVIDICKLLPINKQLAVSYTIDTSDISNMCSTNAKVAASIGRHDLAQMWSLLAVTSKKELQPCDDTDHERPWTKHPLGQDMVKSLISHYSKMRDIQTMAMLCCTFAHYRLVEWSDGMYRTTSQTSLLSITQTSNSAGLSPYGLNFDKFADTEWLLGSPPDCPESPDDFRTIRSIETFCKEQEQHAVHTRFLETKLTNQYDEFKRAYSDILYRWTLLEARALVLKFLTNPEERQKLNEYKTVCHYCLCEGTGVQCHSCKRYSFLCAICQVPVKGASNFCPTCGHGGHLCHMMQWFNKYNMCPTGCGCVCVSGYHHTDQKPISTSSSINSDLNPN